MKFKIHLVIVHRLFFAATPLGIWEDKQPDIQIEVKLLKQLVPTLVPPDGTSIGNHKWLGLHIKFDYVCSTLWPNSDPQDNFCRAKSYSETGCGATGLRFYGFNFLCLLFLTFKINEVKICQNCYSV